MAEENYRILGSTLTSIADAIREKTGETGAMYPTEFAEKIAAITGGGGSSADVRYVTFMSEDGTEELYKRAVLAGNDCGDVVSLGLLDEQTKEPTNTEIFTQSGWALTPGGTADSSALKNVTEDRTVYAAFEASTRYYTVRFFDGEELKHTVYAQYGTSVDHTLDNKDGYYFSCWNPTPTNITADIDCYAVWEERLTFASASWADIAEISKAGTAADYFSVGDTKDILFNNTETLTVEIVGFNHDYDGSNVRGISVICKTPTTSYLVGDFTHPGKAVYDYNLSSTLLDMLPSELQSVIKYVSKQVDVSYDGGAAPSTTSLKVWLPSLTELGCDGNNVSSSISASEFDEYMNTLGTTYAAYASSSCPANSKGATWPTRTRWKNGGGHNIIYGTAGSTIYKWSTYSTISGAGFAFGFCI